MQSVLEAQATETALCLEIRARWPRMSPHSAELRRLGVELCEDNRLIDVVLRSSDDPADVLRHSHVLLDSLAEDAVVTGHADDLRHVWLDVFCRPGVTDGEGESASQVLALVSPSLRGICCSAGRRYRFSAPVPPDLRPSVERLVGNHLVHCFSWLDEQLEPGLRSGRAGGWPEGSRSIAVAGRDDDGLLQLSRDLGLALDLREMRAVAGHFQSLGRDPTDVELQSLAQTWSEHCSHKTFKATIDLVGPDGHAETIHGLLPAYIMRPTTLLNRPWVRSAFSDNAGVIAFDRRHDVVFKVETHNHPSALEPFGGAHTGVGGVIRDVLAVSAEPIANTDVLCFGPPDLSEDGVPRGAFHPTTTYREVVRGIADYGNNMGIPTVGGGVLFHPGYAANPLVYCGTLGIAPRGAHPRRPEPGDAVLVLGGRTGRDGLHGATMSSERLDRAHVEGTVVQIGNPMTEKALRDVLPRLRDEALYHAIADCGAGGLCSAVGEMGEALGVEVELDRVPLKYPGLRPWEIWLSEAQERMVLAVPPAAIPRVLDLCRAWDVEATVIGRFRHDGRLSIRYRGRVVADLEMAFLHGGRPARRLLARWDPSASPGTASVPQATHGDRPGYPLGRGGPEKQPVQSRPFPHLGSTARDAGEALLALLRHPSIASKEEVIRRYDHEVGAATIVKPLVGDAGPSDAAALKPLPHSWRGVVVAHGINPLYGALDPQAMAMLAVDEALRNLVAVGGSIDRAALLDNFCWGDVSRPDELGSLVMAARGCHDAALAYRVPFICGKDSLYNSSADGETATSIPGTLLISALSVIPDVRRTVSMDLKRAGSRLYLLGLTDDEMGGSHYLWVQGMTGGRVPRVRPKETRRVMRLLTRAIRAGLVHSCHDLSEGGLAVAAAEMVIAGTLGLALDLRHMPVADALHPPGDEALLFAESPGRFLIEVGPEQAERFEALLARLPWAAIGDVTDRPDLLMRHGERTLVDLPLARMASAWRGR